MKKMFIVLALGLLVSLPACSGSLFATPTATPEPTATPLPTATPQPTAAPENSEPVYVEDGLYFALPPAGYDYDISGPILIMGNPDRTITISMFKNRDDGAASPQEIMDAMLESLRADEMEITVEETGVASISGIEGVSSQISCVVNGYDCDGMAVAVRTSPVDFFFIMGIGMVLDSENIWENEGQAAFDEVLASIDIPIQTGGWGQTECAVSEDPTYGTTEANAIRVGGDAFNGPAREDGYFTALLGPNGEAVTYTRTGSVGYEDTILDIYDVTIEGKSEHITLYLDEYAYETLQAPVGFTCGAPFPMVEP